MKKRGGVLLALSLAVWAGRAAGEPTAQERALAESLFQDGKRLAKSGDYDAACPKFVESHRLDPQLGTLLHMAACHERQGRTASAWAEYTEGASLAARAGERDRERIAREHAASLETKLSRMVLEVKSSPEGLQVTLDGKTVGRATLETPFAVDPGDHLVEATAPGHGRWSRPLEVPEGPSLTTVTIPPLPPEGEHHTEPHVKKSTKKSSSSNDTQRIAGFVVGGVGIALVAVGGVLGLVAKSQADDGDELCKGRFCTDEGLSLHDDAHRSAAASTVLFIVGLAAVGTGVVVVLTAPSHDEASWYLGPLLGPQSAGLVTGARW